MAVKGLFLVRGWLLARSNQIVVGERLLKEPGLPGLLQGRSTGGLSKLRETLQEVG